MSQVRSHIDMGTLPSTPEAASLGKFIDFPVSPFTGTHNLDLPLYEIKVGEFSMPISMAYHSAGVKVQEIASRSGMGWLLKAGGTISCAINGKSDLGFAVLDDPGAVTNSIWGGTDVFYYTFGEYSGKFIVAVEPFNEAQNGEVKEVIKLDSNNIKITFTSSAQITIQDEWGNRYFFSLGEYVGDQVKYLAGPIDDEDWPRQLSYTISSNTVWNLRTIILHTGEVISFDYQKDIAIEYDYDGLTNWTNPILWQPPGQYSPNQGYSSRRYARTELLRSINYNGASVSFQYNEDRQDLAGDKVLTGMKIFSDGNIKGFRFAHSYRTAFNAANAVSTFAGKRLFLDSIQDISDVAAPITLYKFKYNETALPHRSSFNQDMWGYFNQTGTAAVMPEEYVYPRSSRHAERYLPFKRPSTEPVELYVPGRNMAVNPSLVQAGILTGVTYSNGGSTTFEYEPNEFLWFPETSSNVQDAYNIKAGGVRIKRIVHTDSTRSQIIKDFEYTLPFAPTKTSGAISNLPLFAYPGVADYTKQATASETVDFYQKVLVHTIRDATVTGSIFNSVAGYRYVTVKTSNNGKTVYQFSFPGAYGETHDDPAKGCSVDMQGFCDNKFTQAVMSHTYYATFGLIQGRMGMDLVSDAPGTFPFVGGINYDWNKGLLIKELQYDQSNKLVARKSLSYYTIMSNRNIRETATGDVCCGAESSGGRLAKYANYGIVTGASKKLKQETKVVYLGTDSVVTIKDIAYDTQKLLVSEETTTNSKQQQKIVQFKYPHQSQSGSAVYTEMVNRNMLAPVIEEKQIVAGNVVKITTTDFDMNWFTDKHLIAPKYVWEKYETGNPVKMLEVKSYDGSANPLSLQKIDGQYAYKWSKAGDVTGEFFNALPEECYYESFEDYAGATIDLEGAGSGKAYYTGDFKVPFTAPNTRVYIVDYWYRDQGKWKQMRKSYVNNMTLTDGDAIDDIRVAPADATMQTYTHDGIYGLTSSINKENKKETYQYDNFGRLSIVRDREGNILKSIRYSYAQKPDVETSALYMNNEKSGVFTRTTCGQDYNGGTVTYKVLKGKYRSSISQADADAKAQADVNENGQDYANIYGTCVEKCNTPDRKWINGVCERGEKRYTRSVKVDDAYDCYYRYYFSDGTSSAEFLDGTYPAPCLN
ncbi:DUF5977 domain-containing protein [Chitinophaga tropicalis]|uniref:DUF5977 domain-containing protein n=1 Tax=Chitinophaga tropicalis TaxID=2683588 RepID=A0A7K1U0K5_9BACT|nr:DUF5977 domain-containing protein [Chitinophaga tropicalis]MVT07830.1 hypothetical protein [Chitinophaga tropicalis]